MTRRKSIITSLLIMIPFGGILVFLYEQSVWTSQPFLIALALYGFANLWKLVVHWLETPDVVRERKHKKPAKVESNFDSELNEFMEEYK